MFGATVAGPRWVRGAYTLWEVPVFTRAGSMLPLAPPATSATAMGGARRPPDVLLWEVWHSGAASGRGAAWEDGSGWVNATYASSGSAVRINVAADSAGPRRYRFDVKQAWPVVGAAACGGGTTLVSDEYDGRALAARVDVETDKGDACVDVNFAGPLSDAALLSSSYPGLRLRAHRLKQQLDDHYPQPTWKTMDLVLAVNTADRIAARPHTAPQEVSAFGRHVTAAVGTLASLPDLTPELRATAAAWMKAPY